MPSNCLPLGRTSDAHAFTSTSFFRFGALGFAAYPLRQECFNDQRGNHWRLYGGLGRVRLYDGRRVRCWTFVCEFPLLRPIEG